MALSRLQRARLMYLWGYRAKDLETFGFTSGRPVSDADRFLGGDWCARHVQSLNDDQAKVLTENKWVFYRLADGFGLPVPRTLGLFDAVHGVSWDGERPLRTVPEALAEVRRQRSGGLVLKPAGGVQGRGVLILDTIDHETGQAVTRSGERTSLEQALGSVDLAGARLASGYVLQEPLRNHPALEELAPTTTNTVRVVTLLLGDGTARVQTTGMRLGRRGGMVDNVNAGGFGVALDAATGVIGPGRLSGSSEEVTHHPDTGVEFAGRQVPHWAETRELCCRAARLFPGLRSLGWDVVVTPTGPVLLEANAVWGARGAQSLSDGWLADPVVRAQFQEAGIPLPTGAFTRDVPERLLEQARGRLRRIRPGRTRTRRRW